MKELLAVLLSVLLYVIFADVQTGPGLIEWTEFLLKVEQDCINKTEISKAVIDRTKVTKELPDDPQYKEYISCFYKKQGYQNDDGDILFYNIKNMINDLTNNASIATDIVNSCKDIRKRSSHEDYAYTVAKCLLESSKRATREEETQ